MVGTLLKFKFSDVSQGPTLQAGRSVDGSGSATLTLSCTGGDSERELARSSVGGNSFADSNNAACVHGRLGFLPGNDL